MVFKYLIFCLVDLFVDVKYIVVVVDIIGVVFCWGLVFGVDDFVVYFVFFLCFGIIF